MYKNLSGTRYRRWLCTPRLFHSSNTELVLTRMLKHTHSGNRSIYTNLSATRHRPRLRGSRLFHSTYTGLVMYIQHGTKHTVAVKATQYGTKPAHYTRLHTCARQVHHVLEFRSTIIRRVYSTSSCQHGCMIVLSQVRRLWLLILVPEKPQTDECHDD